VKLRYSPRSLRDLEGIRTYITKESGDRNVADRFLGSLLDECEFLVVLPERYPPYRRGSAWRMMPFGNYLIFFQVHGDEVRIGHVRHGARRPFRG
jgi:plasmid stabilization system protein ParE